VRLEERTPGIARALRALAAAKRRNKSRVAHGEKPVIAGKSVPIKTYVRKYGKPKTQESLSLLDAPEIETADIFDAEDVQVAVDLLRDEDYEDLRSYVVERAAELDASSLIPPDWTVEPMAVSESPDLLPEFDQTDIDEMEDEEIEVVEEYADDLDELSEADQKEAPSARIAKQKADPAKAPKYIFGRLNKAYRKNASAEDIKGELAAIKGRAQAKGKKGTDAAVSATYAKNLEKRVKAAIIARAMKKYGKAPSASAVEATYQRYGKAWVDKLTKQAGATKAPASAAPAKAAPAKPAKAVSKPARTAPKKTPGRKVLLSQQEQSTRRSVKEGEEVLLETTDGDSGVLLSEAEGKKNVFDVLVIQPGMSKNGRRYRAAVLESSVPLLDGARSFASDGPDHDPRKRGVKALVGWWSSPRYETEVALPNGKVSEGIVARYHVTDRDLAEMLRESIEGGKPDLITFSIVADGEVQRVTESGRTLVDVVRINAYESVDPVINAAAGGMAVRLVASVEDPSMDWARLTLAEAVKGLVTGEITADDLQSNRPDLFDAIEDGRITVPDSTDVKGTIAEALAPFQTERIVESTLGGHARLPDIVKARIREKAAAEVAVNKRALTKEEVDRLVEAETEYLAVINPAIVTNAGPVVTDVKSERDRVTEAMYDIIAGKSNDSFKGLYVDLTGDRGMSGHLQEGGRLTESMTTTTFAEVLGDSITRRMLEVYALPDLGSWREIANVVPLNDFRTQRRIRMGGYGNLPAVAQGNPYTALTTPGDEEATYTISKRGGTEDITMETVANDDLGALRAIPTRLGRAAAQTLYEFVWDFLATNATIYDSTALAASGHSNYTTSALSASTLITARTAMKKQTDMSNSKRLGIKPKYLVVPVDLEQTAYELTQTDREVASANNTVNFIRTFSLQPLVVDYWTDATNWWLVADKSLVPTIEIGFFNGREEPELFLQDMPNVGSVFSNDTLTYKVRHIYGGAVVDFRGFYGAIVA